MDENYTREIVLCVEKAMKTENFSKMKIDLGGTTTKGEGFIADLIFATVTESNKDNKYKELHLAIKLGKRSKEFRIDLPAVIDCYRRELFIYDTVLPAFHKFQLEKNIVNIFDAFPKCYGTVLSDDIEALVLEDLKKEEFILHDKQVTMNLQHLHLVLKNYAKLHALSFAFRDQNKDEFNKVTADCSLLHNKFLTYWVRPESDVEAQMVLKEAGRDDLAAKYVEDIKNNSYTRIKAVLDDVPQESVIIHGDSHNNNFLFQYEGNDKGNPLRVVIIDWQISGLHSPVLDLSYFLYCSASRKELFQMDELLKFYHLHLTEFMKQLGSDAREVFPYSTLVQHWRKYSVFGFIVSKIVVKAFYIPQDQLTESDGKKDDPDAGRNITLQNEDVYKERLISSFDHYFSYNLNK